MHQNFFDIYILIFTNRKVLLSLYIINSLYPSTLLGARKLDSEMEDPQSTSSRGGADQSSVTVAVFPLMEDSLERLKYLNYEKEYCVPRKRPLLDNLTFIYPAKNPSVQFQNLLDLSSWLLDLITKESDYLNLDKYDDPHTSANKLALALKSPQVELNLDFPLAKIKQGKV